MDVERIEPASVPQVREDDGQMIDALIAAHIEPHPHHPGEGDVRLKVQDGGVPVWALIGATTDAGDNLIAVARSYRITDEAMAAAWAYYHRHKAAIDARLAENDAA